MDWSERYNTPLNVVFSRQHKLEIEWKVELALLKALGESNIVPKEAYEEAKAVIECASVAIWLHGLRAQ
jgi:adenylosuccinate lyase